MKTPGFFLLAALTLILLPGLQAQNPPVVFSDLFEDATTAEKWRVNETSFETGVGSPNVTLNDSNTAIVLSAGVAGNFWPGVALTSERTFSASAEDPLHLQIERVSVEGEGSAYRSGVWISTADRSQYVFFGQNIGENGWQYNRLIGAEGDSATGSGVNIDAFDALDDDTGPQTLRIVANGSTVQLFLGDTMGAEVDFPVTDDILFEFGVYARAEGDNSEAVFDNAEVRSDLPLGYPCISVSPASVNLSAGEDSTLTVRVPSAYVAENDVSVTLTSSDPGVAMLEGMDGAGSLTLNFPAGGASTNTAKVIAGTKGTATMDVSTAQAELCLPDPLPVRVFSALVKDPSFEETPRPEGVGYGPIDAWMEGSGINDGPPFGDNSTIPDREQIAFIQGAKTIAQQISGLTADANYWLQFRYNRRICCASPDTQEESTINMYVEIDDTEVARVDNIEAARDAPYYFMNIPFKAAGESLLLEIGTEVAGDATLLLDAVTIVERGADNVVLQNPSFEASGVPAWPGYINPADISGWSGAGNYGVNLSGAGPFADNGLNPDQDLVAFVQGQDSSLSQTLDRFVPGTEYMLTFTCNARSANTPNLQVKLGDAVLLDEAITPVSGANPYHEKTITFTASNPQDILSFIQTAEGDQTVLIDDVRLVGASSEFACLDVDAPGEFSTSVGQSGSEIVVTVEDEVVADGDVTVNVVSSDLAVIRFSDAIDDGSRRLVFANDGPRSQTVSFNSIAKGTATIAFMSPQAVCFSRGSVDVTVRSGFVSNPGFETNPPTAFPTYGPIDGWEGSSNTGVNNSMGPFHDNGIIPGGAQVGFVQGSNKLYQDIGGLTVGQSYWLQFFYNSRNCCGGTIGFTVTYGDQVIFEQAEVVPVGEGMPYYYVQAPFVADTGSGRLSFNGMAMGDASFLVDAVTIVAREDTDIPVVNPSFETTGAIPAPGYLGNGELALPLAGWTMTGNYGVNVSGAGPFANNGVNPDQDSVLFLQNAGSSASQMIGNLVPGENYTLSYAYNAREGNTPHLSVTIGGLVAQDADVSPVGGGNPYEVHTFAFEATEGSMELVFAQTTEGDHTVLIDDVRVGGGGEVVPCAEVSPLVMNLKTTQEFSGGSITLPDGALDGGPLSVSLTSDDPGVATVSPATLDFAQGGNLSQSFSVTAVSSGQTSIRLAAEELCFNSSRITVNVSSALLSNGSFDGSPVPADPGYGSIQGWDAEGGTGLNGSEGPFHDNGIVPDRSQIAFLQGVARIQQTVAGLEVGETYWLQFFYNARNCCGGTIDLAVLLGGTELAVFENVQPVGEAQPYHQATVVFQAEAAQGLLEFATTVPEGEDASVLLDAVTLTKRSPEDVVILNPGFEASGTPDAPGYISPDPMAGWTVTGGGYGVNTSPQGPFANNGINPEQEHVGFIQGLTTMSQVVGGFTAGASYELRFFYNAREGNSPVLSVSVDGDELLQESVAPVGDAPYHQAALPFNASGSTVEISFAQVEDGDQSLVFDDIRIVRTGDAPDLPELFIQGLPDNRVRVLWTGNGTPVVLQRSSDLITWTDETDTMFSEGVTFFVSAIGEREGYFRLRAEESNEP